MVRVVLSLFFALTLLFPAVLTAQEYDSQTGWKIRPPAGWKFAVQDGRVVFGHDVEAGMIIASFAPNMDVEALKKEARAGLQEEGINLMPTGEPTTFKAKAGQAVDVTLAGTDQAQTQLKARAIAVVGPSGAVVLLGITTPPQFENMAKRVREAADNVSFYKPKVGDAAKLRGTFCRYSSYSSGYATSNSFSSSRTERMTFDGAGRVAWGSQMLVSSNTETDTSSSSASGIFGDGSATNFGTYAVVGNAVTIQWSSGPQTCQVHMRQDDGRITELKCGDNLWAPQLCD